MSKKQVTIQFICDFCGLLHNTEDEANACAVKDAFQEQLYLIDSNPDFDESEYDSDEDFEIDESEINTNPENAASIDQVKLVSIHERIHGWRTTVYIREPIIPQEQFADLNEAVGNAIFYRLKLDDLFSQLKFERTFRKERR